MHIAVPEVARKKFATHFWPAAVAVVFLFLGIPLFDRTPPFEVSNGRVLPYDGAFTINPGDLVQVRWDVVWHRIQQCTIDRQIRDSEGFWRTIDSYALRVPREKGEAIGGSEFKISIFHPSGPAQYRATALCRDERNPVHYFWPLRIDMPDLEFVVVR